MSIFNVSYAFYDDLCASRQCETTVRFSLEQFRNEMHSRDGEESAEVAFTGRDGNDYAIVNTGEGFTLIVLDNGPDGKGEVIIWSEGNRTLSDAMQALTHVVVTDAAE